MEIGVCTSAANSPDISGSGVDFIEENVQNFLVPEESNEIFAEKSKAPSACPLPIRAANCFLPGTLKCVGPDVDMGRILRYAGTAFRRAGETGIGTIVFGSGGSRTVPKGFSADNAKKQIVDLLKELGPLAEARGVTVVLEPLNSGDCNFINSLREGAELVEACSHPAVALLADIYHMARDGEDPEEISRFGKMLRHAHIAEEEKRTSPGTMGDDFRPYLKALADAGYGGAISLECRWEDMALQIADSLRYLRGQAADAVKSFLSPH